MEGQMSSWQPSWIKTTFVKSFDVDTFEISWQKIANFWPAICGVTSPRGTLMTPLGPTRPWLDPSPPVFPWPLAWAARDSWISGYVLYTPPPPLQACLWFTSFPLKLLAPLYSLWIQKYGQPFNRRYDFLIFFFNQKIIIKQIVIVGSRGVSTGKCCVKGLRIMCFSPLLLLYLIPAF